MPRFEFAVDAPGGTGRIELENARFGTIHTWSKLLTKQHFGICDDANIRIDGGRHLFFRVDIAPTQDRYSIRMFGQQGRCYMWFRDEHGNKFRRNYGDGQNTEIEFSQNGISSISVEELNELNAEIA